MIESWIQECSELAPYLKEKLAADKVHSWLTAPYIHQKVRDALAEHEPQRAKNAHWGYMPRQSYEVTRHFYPYTPDGGGGGVGNGGLFYGTAYEALVNQSLQSQIENLRSQIQTQQLTQQQQDQIQTILNTPLITDYKEFISRIY